VSKYSVLAAKRYRQYIREKQKESLIHRLVALILLILNALIRTVQRSGIKKARTVEKINVDREEL
jgi:hypothetical protein